MQTQVEQFLQFVAVEKGYSEHTVAAYRNDLTQFLTYLGGEASVSSWAGVDGDHIRSYMLYLKQRDYASSSVGRKMASIKSFFHFLVADGVVVDDPAAAVDTPQVERRLPNPLTRDQMERLLAAAAGSDTAKGLRDRALLELMYATGMRASEVIQLGVNAVDLERGVVRCVGKGNKERILPIHQRAREALENYVEKGRPRLLRGRKESIFFLNHRGRPLTRQGLWLIVKEYAAVADITRDVTPHTLRHSFATHMLDGGAGLRELQQLLGHTNIASTQIYTEVSTRRKRDAYDKAHPRA